MNVVQQLQACIHSNPHRKREVIPIEISTVSDTQEGELPVTAVAGGWVPTPLEPPGPLSLYLWKTNPEFRAGTPPVRRTIIRDSIMHLTERVDNELRGIKWSRKKVLEQLAEQQTSAVSPPMDTHELDNALCHLYGYQKISVDEANKKIRFFPPDPRMWSTDIPVWGATAGSRAVLHRAGEESVGYGLGIWLGQRETEGWKVDWPEADGTLEAIKHKMAGLGVGMGLRLDKPKKVDWAMALGRIEALSKLSQFVP
jgi:hypothetical protein